MSKGYLYMLVAGLLFAGMNVGVKAIPNIPSHQIVCIRAAISLVLCYLMLRKQGINPWGNRQGLLILRGIFGALSFLMFFFTLQHMPLATAVTLQYLAPLFTVALGWIVLHERVSAAQWLCFSLAFAGVFFVKGFDSRVSLLVLLIGIVSALLAGLAYVVVRKLRESDSSLVVVFYLPLVALPLIGPYTAFHWETPTKFEWLVLLAIALLSHLAQLLMTKAYQAERLAQVAILNYLGIVYALALGWLLFGEWIPTAALIGLLLIALGVIGNAYLGHGTQRL